MIEKFQNTIKKIILNENFKDTIFSYMTYGVFAFISYGMTITNIVTHRKILMIATLSFGILCTINLFLSIWNARTRKIARVIFAIELMSLFTYFIITGGTDQFSIVWVLLLPVLGLFFFGIPAGSILCAYIEIFMLLCFHFEPLRAICTDYGDTFRLRFPMVFFATYLVALVMEAFRTGTSRELLFLQEKYKKLYIHDSLTGLHNRYGLNNEFMKTLDEGEHQVTVAILDLDYFKKVNDTYGHAIGDRILVEVSTLIKETLPSKAFACRWGGEEFALIFREGIDAEQIVRDMMETIRTTVFCKPVHNISLTVSVGIARDEHIYQLMDLDRLMIAADNNLYRAKESGRNRIVSGLDTDTKND